VTACSGDDSSSPASQPGAGGTSTGSDAAEEAASLETTATLGRVTGSLPKGKRSKVRRQVAHAVDEWFDAAYIDGEYPRNDFENAWPGFTVGARADAHADKALMSNQDIGGRIDAVEPLARKVTVDVLAVRGKAQGASARVLLKFKTDGDIHRKVEVRGRLFLIPSPEGWRIFGYDVTKGRAA
jgi:hypothetical protein